MPVLFESFRMAALRHIEEKVDPSRNWNFTLNNYTPQDEEKLQNCNSVRYLLYGREIGEECKTPHLQGLIIFKSVKTLGAVKRFLPNAHWGNTISFEGSVRYCKKEGDFFEKGQPLISKKRQGENERERWERAWQIASTGGDLMEIDPDIRIRMYGTLKKIRKDFMAQVPDTDDVCGTWIWGAPGVGKSRKARLEWPGAYLKGANKWWDGYQGEEAVVLDEVELKAGEWLGHYLKIWADRYAFIAECKGGAMRIRPKAFVITSNYSPDEVFNFDAQLLAAIRRRFKVIHMTQYSPEVGRWL